MHCFMVIDLFYLAKGHFLDKIRKNVNLSFVMGSLLVDSYHFVYQ